MPQIRHMLPDEAPRVSDLIRDVFDELLRQDFTAEGNAIFYAAVREFLFEKRHEHRIWVAVEAGELLGMISVKGDDHISLFHVARQQHRRGIGRALFEAARAEIEREAPQVTRMDVNSSTYAVPIYEKLGFRATSEPQRLNGMVFVPMELELRSPGRTTPQPD